MTFTGTGRIIRLVLRRDRVRLLLWTVGLAGIVVSSAASVRAAYPNQQSIDSYSAIVGGNPAAIVFVGPGYGADDPNIGTVLVNEVQLYAMIAVALMSIFLLNRHTRAEEDVERAELLRSGVMGRHAAMAGAITVVAVANLAIAALCALGFIAFGYSAVGSLALAASFLAVGWVFLGVAAVTTQVASGGRSAVGMASIVLLVAFVLRAIGDVGENFARWLSPFGWAQGIRAFADERWWVMILCALLTAALVVVGFRIGSRRDLGSGLVPQRLGPRHAPASLYRPLGLAIRLQRGMLAGWIIGMFCMGVVFGSLGQDVHDLVEESDLWADVMVQFDSDDVVDSFFATGMTMLGMISAGFALIVVQRLRIEESAGRVEPILATAVSRLRWVAGHVSIGVLGTVAIMAASGLGAGLAYAVVSGDASQIGRLVGAGLVTVPAIVVLLGIGMVLFGLWPAATPASWGVLVIVVLAGFFDELLRLPSWAQRLSTFHYVPSLPAESMSWTPVAALSGAAVVAIVAGHLFFRRRDVEVG